MGKGKKAKGKLEKEKKGEPEAEHAVEVPTDRCVCPQGCVIGSPVGDNCDEDDVVHITCTGSKCNQPKVIHKDCFDIWETAMIRVCEKSPYCSTYYKKVTKDWGSHWLHDQLWAESRGYALIRHQCTCLCGGSLRKDNEYYQLKKAKETAKNNRKAAKNVPKGAVAAKKVLPKAVIPKAFTHGPSVFTEGNFVQNNAQELNDENHDEAQGKPSLPVGMSIQPKKKKKNRQRADSGVQDRSDTPCSSLSNTNSLMNHFEDMRLGEDAGWEPHDHILKEHDKTDDSWENVPIKHALKESTGNNDIVKPPPGFEIRNRFADISNASSVAGTDNTNGHSYDNKGDGLGADYNIDSYLPYIALESIAHYRIERIHMRRFLQHVTDYHL